MKRWQVLDIWTGEIRAVGLTYEDALGMAQSDPGGNLEYEPMRCPQCREPWRVLSDGAAFCDACSYCAEEIDNA